jgi:hypothetical protein
MKKQRKPARRCFVGSPSPSGHDLSPVRASTDARAGFAQHPAGIRDETPPAVSRLPASLAHVGDGRGEGPAHAESGR